MEYLVEGEKLAKIKVGSVGTKIAVKAGCGGNGVYCSRDEGCGQWSKCIAPTTYAGCSGGVLTFPRSRLEKQAE